MGGFFIRPEFIKRTAKYTKNAKGVFKRLCGINGGITVFETSFARVSQNGRRQFRELAGTQTYGTFLRRLLLLRLADRLAPRKVSNTTPAAAALITSPACPPVTPILLFNILISHNPHSTHSTPVKISSPLAFLGFDASAIFLVTNIRFSYRTNVL